jgi:hypothetical protein
MRLVGGQASLPGLAEGIPRLSVVRRHRLAVSIKEILLLYPRDLRIVNDLGGSQCHSFT